MQDSGFRGCGASFSLGWGLWILDFELGLRALGGRLDALQALFDTGQAQSISHGNPDTKITKQRRNL